MAAGSPCHCHIDQDMVHFNSNIQSDLFVLFCDMDNPSGLE